jgi:hypothetical protein
MPFRFNSPLNLAFESEDPNVLNRVSVITAGEAKGHHLFMDDDFLARLVELGNEKPRGVRSRFGHPDICTDAIGTELGMFRNFRKEGSQVFADVHFVVTESNKDMISHIKEFAAKEPGVFGTSIVFEPAILRDEDGEPILNKWGETEMLIKEVDGKRYIGIDSFDAVDFVDSPAANPSGIYSKKFNQERDKVISRYVSRFLEDNPKVKKFVEYIFSHTKKEETNMPKKARQLSRYFPKSMGESPISGGGGVIIYPSETPQVNDEVIWRDEAGNELPAPNGTYPLENGFTITVMDGVITEVVEAASEAETPAELRAARNQERFLKQEVESMRRQMQLLNEKQELSEKLAKATPALPAITTNPTNDFSFAITSGKDNIAVDQVVAAASLFFKARQKKNKGKYAKYVNPKKKAEVAFSSGWDLTNMLARCIPYLEDVIYDTVINDSLLSMMTNITARVPDGNVNAFSVDLPRMDFNPYELWRVDAFECNSFNPVGTFKPDQRRIEVLPIVYEQELCAKDVRNLWNGMIYIDEQSIPAEAILMTMIMERLVNDLEKIAMFGRTGTGGTINGIYNEIQTAKTSGCIPASQVLPPAIFTDTNTISQIEALYDLLPPFMREMTDLNAFVPPRIWEYYYRNYRSAFTFNYELKDRGLIPDIDTPIEWKRLYTFSDNTLTQNAVLITSSNNLYYILERAGAESNFESWYMQTEQLIRFRWQNFFGTNFASCNQMVINF